MYDTQELSYTTLSTLLKFAEDLPQNSTIEVTQLGGALAARDATETPFYHRDANFEIHAIISWNNQQQSTSRLSHAKKFVSSFSDSIFNESLGSYVNIDNILEHGDLVDNEHKAPSGCQVPPLARVYGLNFDRLVQVNKFYLKFYLKF